MPSACVMCVETGFLPVSAREKACKHTTRHFASKSAGGTSLSKVVLRTRVTTEENLEAMLFSNYDATSAYDEMFSTNGGPRRGTELLFDRLGKLTGVELLHYQNTAMATMRSLGITFNVYGH